MGRQGACGTGRHLGARRPRGYRRRSRDGADLRPGRERGHGPGRCRPGDTGLVPPHGALPAMTDFRFGILLWSQATTWPEMLDAARRVDRLPFDHLWTWDHLHPIMGDPLPPIYDG